MNVATSKLSISSENYYTVTCTTSIVEIQSRSDAISHAIAIYHAQ